VSASGGSHGGSLKWAGGVGYEADGPDGLSMLGARYYDPVVGRFVSPDPISFAGGMNLYAYCDGDPVNAVDPSGLYDGPVNQNGEYHPIGDGGFASGAGGAYQGAKGQFFSNVRRGGDAAYTALDYASPFIPGATAAMAMDKAGKGNYVGAAIQVSGPVLGIVASKAGGTCGSRGFLGWLRGVFGGPATPATIKSFLAAKAGSGSVRYFKSFYLLKKGLGSPGSGNVWHHIVEQRLCGVFGKEAIQNSQNVAAIPSAANKAIADYYSRVLSYTGGKTLRKWLEGESFEYQHEFGVRVMNRILQGGKLPQ
jgi:RHS repeat-associated protein